jgi:hypothetical protein
LPDPEPEPEFDPIPDPPEPLPDPDPNPEPMPPEPDPLPDPDPDPLLLPPIWAKAGAADQTEAPANSAAAARTIRVFIGRILKATVLGERGT